MLHKQQLGLCHSLRRIVLGERCLRRRWGEGGGGGREGEGEKEGREGEGREGKRGEGRG